MEGNKALLDANAVLRFLLRDNEEQFIYIRKMVRTIVSFILQQRIKEHMATQVENGVLIQ